MYTFQIDIASSSVKFILLPNYLFYRYDHFWNFIKFLIKLHILIM